MFNISHFLSEYIHTPDVHTPLRPHKRRELATPISANDQNKGLLQSWLIPKLSAFDKRQLEFDLDIMELLIWNDWSFMTVENEGFKKFFAKHLPKFSIKAATTFSR
jgi:hypothetical protein